MPEFLSVPLKVVGEVDLIKPLSTLLKTKSYPNTVIASLTHLQALRSRMVAAIQAREVTISALEAMQSYYDQLGNLETKIPFTEAKIYFKWLDAFDKGGWLGGNIAYTMSTSLLYEKACVLFNVAALSTQLGATQDITQEDGLKKAVQLFQSSAGIFNAMTVPLPVHSTEQKPTLDLSADCVEALGSLCLAQAQDCVLMKALRDQKKPGVVAKLSAHARDLYKHAGVGLGRSTVRGMWESNWISTVEKKQCLYQGLTELHQAGVCQETGKVGERIARLQLAKKSLSSSPDWLGKTEAALTQAVKDNDFIYHERVPPVEQLEDVQPAPVVKATPLPQKLRIGRESEDLFEMMPPWGEAKLKKEECVIS